MLGGPEEKAVRVAVVIVTYQSEPVVRECLQALSAPGGGVELGPVVVVDNASTDATLDAVRSVRSDAVVVASPTNLGYAAAINLGRSHCGDPDAVLVLNPDTVLAPGAVSRLAMTAVGADPCVAVPRLTSPDGSLSLSLRRFPTVRSAVAESVLGGARAGRWGLGEVVGDPSFYESQRVVDWATGAAVLVPRPCSDRVGEWDESFFLYSEETDFMARSWQAGFPVRYVPDAVCGHVGGASGSSPALWALLVTNKVRLYARTHGAVSTTTFRVAVLAGQLVRAATGDPRSRAAAQGLMRSLGEGPRMTSKQ